MCAPHFPPFELQSRPRCSAVVPLFLTPSPFTLSPSSSLKLLSLPSSSVHFGVVVASFLVCVVALARRRLCPTAHGCPVAPLRRSTRWHCHTSHLPSQPPAEDALSAPVLPPTTACSSANDARLSVTSVSPPLAQARVSPRLSASPPRLHHWQRQNRNRLEACNLCNVRNFGTSHMRN